MAAEPRGIDLNADLGEGCGDDDAILACVSSANIACGGHAGDADTMRAAVESALAQGVAIGAHPGYADREHFGRRDLAIPTESLYSELQRQLAALAAIVERAGGRLRHVKPHGALYNQAARDPVLAGQVARAVRAFDPALKLVGLAGSLLLVAAEAEGLVPVAEVFADRAYLADGSLAPRGQPGAVLEAPEAVLAQALRLARAEAIATLDGGSLVAHAQTICVHGDGAHALLVARQIRQGLESAGFRLRAA